MSDPIRVEVDGLPPMEFDAGTSPEVIQRTVKRIVASQQTTNPSEGASLKIGPWDTGIGLPPKLTETLAGAGRRFEDIFTLGNRPDKDPTADAALNKSGYATLGSAGADLATLIGGGTVLRGAGAMMNAAGKVPMMANALTGIGQNMIMPTSLKNAAAVGGLYNAATEGGDAMERAKTGATGAALGAVGYAIPKAIGNVIKPNLPPDVQALRDLNIRMTPGQMAGGAWNTTEQKMMSLPIVGDAIKGARMRSVEDFNRAIANEVVAPLGVKTTQPAGRELVRETQSIVRNAYDDVLNRITATFNPAMNDAIDAGKGLAATAGQDGRFDAILKQTFYGKFTNPQGFITGKAFKEIDSGLAEAVRGAWSKGDAELAKAVQGVRDALRMTAQGSAKDLAKLKAADTAFAKLVRMENAAGMRGAKDGIFSPANFGNAVDRGAGRSAKAAGKELMGPLSDAAEARLSSNFPNSGTFDRAALNTLALGGAGAAAGYFGVDPTYLALMGLGAGAYTRPGQALMRGAMARPSAAALTDIASGMRSAAPLGGLLGPTLLPIYAHQQ